MVTTTTGNIRVKAYRELTRDLSCIIEVVHPDNVWDDVKAMGNNADLDLSYPTQKPEALLERIIKASSNPNSLVLDCFAGSGTTAAVAQKLGRRWITCDINKGAIQTTAKRLTGIMQTQAQQLNVGETQPTLNYAYYRVNNYDLQEQHNEFKSYVLNHYGVEPDKKQAFFDGVRGDRLVKVVPFTQPATIEDLQLIQDELKLNLNESRPIDLFCLGAELRLQEAIKQHKRLNPINKITVIDIRLEDGIIQHQPDELSVNSRMEESECVVELTNYISPTIMARLSKENETLLDTLDDFKRQLEWVCIDADYNGSVFKATVQDAPLKKKDLVQGLYRLPLSSVGERIAVKTIDILGEEVLVVVEKP
ncbi:MAG: DNA-methyltransferase [Vampirovibrionales bacterium]